MSALRSLLIVATSGFLAVAAPLRAQDELNDRLFTEMTALVIPHDLAIIVGLSPTPLIQLGAETVEFASNLSLKYVPPWLEAPPHIGIDPTVQGTNGTYVADGCGIEFPLLSTEADYENMFGLANFNQSYTDPVTGTNYPWHNRVNPLGTRWGFLRAPTVWHANTEVKLRLASREQVRRYDSATGTLSDPYWPIVSSEDPQSVYLPIGEHVIDWRAATQLNRVSDIAVPAVLLTIGMLTEIKNAWGGLDRARSIKQSGSISNAVINEPLDPQGAQRLSEGVGRFDQIWQGAWKKRTAAGDAARDRNWWRELRKNVGCLVVDLAVDVLDTAIDNRLSTLDATTADELLTAGHIGRLEAEVLDAIHSVWVQKNLDMRIDAVKAAMTCDDPHELIVAVIETLLNDPESDVLKSLLTTETVANIASQYILVYDSEPPMISLPATPLVIEATDFGGTRLHRARPTLRAIAEAGSWDNCGRRPELVLVAPDVLPVGLSEVTWIARDLGPNPPGDTRNFAPTAVQQIRVQDTQPPLLLAPPSKVIEAVGAVSLAAAQIGTAAAVDLVDVQPSVVHDAPATFLLDQRTTIRWTATDQSGNAAQAEQLVSVKTVGTNTTPIANAASARTLTAQPVDIRLTAIDNDVLGGTADPLWFKIESHPARGEFIAPLYPFFIEDYRTRPNDALGPDFDPVSDDLHQYIVDTYCSTDLEIRQPPIEFVHNAAFVHVTDEGIRYVLDEFYDCLGLEENAEEVARFSKWSADGEFLGQVEIGQNEERPLDDTFVVDRDGNLYYYIAIEPSSSSNTLRLIRCSTDWTGGTRDRSQVCNASYGFDQGSVPSDVPLDARSLKVARIDSATGVAYVADDFRLFAFELLDNGGTRYLGEVGPRNDDTVVENWLGNPSALEVGSDGSLYVADVGDHRIHKIGAARRSGEQQLVLGDYIGWSGRCTGSGNRACDEDLGRSRGYSCTFAPNSCTVAGASSGSAQGQYNEPRFIAIDPNDVLYVADYANARIQRLSTDGTFAGEAVSDGSGINKGERPSFVVGNMGRPSSVAVNSSQFYVVDRDERFVHVFGTLPFKEITPSEVTVTYVSDQDFPNPNIAGNDAFTYSVTDGLARSLPATVTITVDRNFRAPIAIDTSITTDEDVSVTFGLEADDPDGVAGRDFLGLDFLTFTVTSEPRHGALTGGGETWTYRPDAGFSGTDRVRFRANDGRDDSNEGTVTITVTAENDPPEVTIEEPWRVPVGFPMLLRVTFEDDPAESHEGRVVWGDGTSSVTGQITDGQDTSEDPALNGVVVTRPPAAGGEGRIFSQHTYSTPGSRTITVCLTDDGGLEGCDTLTVLVEPLVQLGVGSVVYDEPLGEDEVTDQEILDGVPFTYELTISNGMPSEGAGHTAENLLLEAELPSDLQIVDILTDHGTCAVTGLAMSCSIGSLAPAAEAKVEVRAHGRGTLLSVATRDFSGLLTTTSAAVEDEIEVLVGIDLLPNLADGDGDGMPEGYERANGLELTRADANEDADGDGLSNGIEFGVGTSARAVDTDGDGLDDFAEYTAGTSDPTVADTDGDGMPDGWELAHGFNPRVVGDGDDDADGDGLSNSSEFEAGQDPRRDDVAPEIAPPPAVTVAATGRLTRVELGAASAADGRDGEIRASANPAGPFAPGAHVVTWIATDAAGNQATALQHVNVVPLAEFAVDQSVEEGSSVRVRVELNGPAATYPVAIPYSIAGTATSPADHDGASGTLYLTSGVVGSIDITTVRDAIEDHDETIVVTMGSPLNAAAGVKTEHTITIAEHNLAPRVSVLLEQAGVPVTTVARDGGNVTVTAAVRDDPGRAHAYDWRGSDAGAFDPAFATAASYVIDAAALAARTYVLEVRVTDDAVPALRGEARTVFRVVDRLPFLNPAVDSDGDGLDDRTEGAADIDGDRIAEYLDVLSSGNQLQLGDEARALEVSVGHALRLGEVAFSLGLPHARIAEDHLTADTAHGYPNGVVDFEVTQIEPGGQANVVLPLRHAIAPGAVYRKHVRGVWRDFSETHGDAIASATGEGDGVCPPPRSAAYRPGLFAGDTCVQLTLTDGGPNDSDGLANGIVHDPGGLAVPVAVTLEVVPLTAVLEGLGADAAVLRLRLRTMSGDVMLRSLTLAAAGTGDERFIKDVLLVADADADGVMDADEHVLARGRYARNDGELRLTLDDELELPFGTTEILVVYRTEAASP